MKPGSKSGEHHGNQGAQGCLNIESEKIMTNISETSFTKKILIILFAILSISINPPFASSYPSEVQAYLSSHPTTPPCANEVDTLTRADGKIEYDVYLVCRPGIKRVEYRRQQPQGATACNSNFLSWYGSHVGDYFSGCNGGGNVYNCSSVSTVYSSYPVEETKTFYCDPNRATDSVIQDVTGGGAFWWLFYGTEANCLRNAYSYSCQVNRQLKQTFLEDCMDGAMRHCYTGLNNTRSTGICEDGTQACLNGHWETGCPGQVLPLDHEICNDGLDNNCNGDIDEHCCDIKVTKDASATTINPSTGGMINLSATISDSSNEPIDWKITLPTGIEVTGIGTHPSALWDGKDRNGRYPEISPGQSATFNATISAWHDNNPSCSDQADLEHHNQNDR